MTETRLLRVMSVQQTLPYWRAACARQGGTVPQIPERHRECMSGSASCSATNSQEVQDDVLGNDGEVAVVVAFTLSNREL